jgi:hypothetical protein
MAIAIKLGVKVDESCCLLALQLVNKCLVIHALSELVLGLGNVVVSISEINQTTVVLQFRHRHQSVVSGVVLF